MPQSCPAQQCSEATPGTPGCPAWIIPTIPPNPRQDPAAHPFSSPSPRPSHISVSASSCPGRARHSNCKNSKLPANWSQIGSKLGVEWRLIGGELKIFQEIPNCCFIQAEFVYTAVSCACLVPHVLTVWFVYDCLCPTYRPGPT